MQTFNHFNILKAHELIETDNYNALVLEYCSGRDMPYYMKSREIRQFCEYEAIFY